MLVHRSQKNRAPQSTAIAFRLPSAAIEGVDEIARRECRSRANMIQVMIERYLSCPQCRKAAKAAIVKEG